MSKKPSQGPNGPKRKAWVGKNTHRKFSPENASGQAHKNLSKEKSAAQIRHNAPKTTSGVLPHTPRPAHYKTKPTGAPKSPYMQPARKNPEPVAVYPMRINKYLALKKHSTRRGADELIEKKQVFINGRHAVLGDKVLETDNVEVRFRGKQIPYVYYTYNKPRGIVTHSAQRGDSEIKHEVSLTDVFPIGRLDKDSHGLIILTNDGRITERLLGPTFEHEKEYFVRTKNKLRTSFKKNMEAGVKIDAEKTAPCKVHIVSDNSFKIVLTEGKKHQIRRMCDALFQEVIDLERVRIMNVSLGKLPEGTHREIIGEELKIFLRLLDLA